ncbi:hypothetical protein ACKWTF_010693 [Chironomus riparius]
MNCLNIFINLSVGFLIITKLIPKVLTYLLEKLYGVKLNVKSVKLLSASIYDLNIKWKDGEVSVKEISFNSKLFDKSFKKLVCATFKTVEVSVFNRSDLEKSNGLRSLLICFNPKVVKFIEMFEITFENFLFVIFEANMKIKTKIRQRVFKLNSNAITKSFKKVSTNNIEFLIVKSKNERWKNFPVTYFHPELNYFTNQYKEFEVREDDIFIAGFPRSGTSRTQEMAWLVANDCDFETALKYKLEVRCPNLDNFMSTFLFHQHTLACSLDDMPSPRTIKTHLPIQLLPDQVWTKKPKIIHISRDVKDVAISNYHFWKSMNINCPDLREFLNCFLNDTIQYGPYRETVHNYLNIPNYENIIYITYETMHADLDGTIMKISKFLEKPIFFDNLQKLKDHLSFEKMKNNKATNNKEILTDFQKFRNGEEVDSDNFIRKGIIGDHKNSMSKEYIDRFDKWWSERSLLKQGF